MLALAAVAAFLVAGVVALVVRRRAHDDFGPSVRDFAAFRAALGAIGSPRDQVRA